MTVSGRLFRFTAAIISLIWTTDSQVELAKSGKSVSRVIRLCAHIDNSLKVYFNRFTPILTNGHRELIKVARFGKFTRLPLLLWRL